MREAHPINTFVLELGSCFLLCCVVLKNEKTRTKKKIAVVAPKNPRFFFSSLSLFISHFYLYSPLNKK